MSLEQRITTLEKRVADLEKKATAATAAKNIFRRETLLYVYRTVF
ncbi:hypothetical protein [Bacillus badius]|nr:hypothetical protein [Bacillus badius]MED4715375.1 hypothetical protein [Bacillus badius]